MNIFCFDFRLRGAALRLVLWLAPSIGLAQAVEDPGEPENAMMSYARSLPDTLLVRPFLNEFSVSLRLLGKSKVQFSGMGLISSGLEDDDVTALTSRLYADGYVGFDQRGIVADAAELSDGFTNNWSYTSDAQITADEAGIMFHAYAGTPDGSVVEADSPMGVNPDLEYSRILWQAGRVVTPRRRAWQLGWLAGWGLSDVNAKFRGLAQGNLIITTDTYSLGGAPVPRNLDSAGNLLLDDDGNVVEGYTAPSSYQIDVVGDDGITTTYVLENTTLLGGRPLERVVQTAANEASIDGFWQVSGAYFTLRSGPWVRWEPVENFSVKLSGGGTFTLLGLSMNYTEQLVIDENTKSGEVGEQSSMRTETYAGLYSSVDGEWLLNERTSIFASAYYEDFDEELTLQVDGREAKAQITSGVGLRIGITTRF